MRPLVVATAFLATGWAFGAGVDLELRSAKTQQLVLEPPDFHLVLVNHGARPVSVALTAVSQPRLRIETDEGWVDCRRDSSGLPGGSLVRWTRIAHGGEVELDLPTDGCPSTAMDPPGAAKYWVEVPARYRLQAEITLKAPARSKGETTAPDDAFTGVLTSNIVSIDVNEPGGVDAQALAWSREHNDSPFCRAALKTFPSSRYAAIALLPHIDVVRSEPRKVKTSIEREIFLVTRSVPDPDAPDGWRSLWGPDLARWSIEHAERILREHPDFSYAGQLRLAIGINQIAAGKESDGRKLLRQLADHPDTREGAWAKEFLGANGQ